MNRRGRELIAAAARPACRSVRSLPLRRPVGPGAGRARDILRARALALALAYRYPAFLDAQRAHRWGVAGSGLTKEDIYTGGRAD